MNDMSLYEQIVEGWERTETENGTPFYVNHRTENTSWDHPYWLKIVEGLGEHAEVKYAAYRTSLKLRQLQTQLRLDHVEISTIRHEFEELGCLEGHCGVLHCDDLLGILVNMYRSSHGSYTLQDEPDMLADLTLNLLLNILDRDKTGCLPVMSAKLILVTLCHAKLTEKYRCFYEELHDPSTFISSRLLQTFLDTLMKLPEFLHESHAFGRNCEPAVASCCQMGVESGGITEDVFYRWLQKEPQTLVWLPTLHRLASTENMKHDVKCNVCKSTPIIGFRYKCLKCFNFDICQKCFFVGRTKKKHKLNHPIQEYCLNATAKDDTSAFMKTVKNNLSRKQRRKSRMKYLPIEPDNQYANLAWSPEQEPPEPDVHSEILETAKRLADVELTKAQEDNRLNTRENTPPEKRRLFSPPQNLSPKDDGLQEERNELNSYIQQLEEENRALYAQLSGLQENSDTESFVSEDKTSPCHSSTPNPHRIRDVLRECNDLPFREPLPHEITPIFLSVPIIHVNGNPTYNSPKSFKASPGTPSAFAQPFYSSPVPYLPPPMYGSPPRGRTFDNHSPSRGRTLDDHSPAMDRTLGDSLDNIDASPGRFSLPSPNKSQNEFQVEEAELQAIVNQAGQAFPANMSLNGTQPGRYSNEYDEDEMLEAANHVGLAMSDFVNRAVNIRLPQ